MERHLDHATSTPATTPCWSRGLPAAQVGGCAAHARRYFEELSRGGAVPARWPPRRCGAGRGSTTPRRPSPRWTRRAAARPAAAEQAAVGGVRGVAEAAAHAGARRQQDRRGDRLQPERLDGADAAPATTARWPSTTTSSSGRSSRGSSARRTGCSCGSELAGQRAAVVMSLVQSAKLNGLDPWAYLRDVLARIHSHPSQPAR